MPNCKLCGLATSREVCDTCSEKLGVSTLPPSRRPATPCMRCNGIKLIRCVPRERTVAPRQDWNDARLAPLTLTQAIDVKKTFMRGAVVEPASVGSGHGILETYTCVKCGFVEWYCQDPENVPIGPEYMTELIDLTSETPYR